MAASGAGFIEPVLQDALTSRTASKFRSHEFSGLCARSSSLRTPLAGAFAIKKPENPHSPRIKDLPRKKSRGLSTFDAPTRTQISKKLDDGEGIKLRHDQAIGQIVSAQANFKRVMVHRAGMDDGQDLESGAASSDCALVPLDGIYGGLQPKAGIELLCVVRALLKKINRRVMVGDKVLVSGVDWVDNRGMIEEVFDRETEILDPPVANVDQMLVLFALNRPKTEPMSLSRFLVEAESTGIPFALVFNKADLASATEVTEWETRMLSWNYKPLFCSVNTKSGISDVLNVLANKTSVVIGPSGVGKSSLINALGIEVGIDSSSLLVIKDNEHVFSVDTESMGVQSVTGVFEEQIVGEVSERSGRGKHTTRHVSLLRIPSGGYFADTPGFNQPGLAKVTTKTLASCFPEIRNRLSTGEGCAFSDCLHVGEPDCVIEGDWERYAHYLQFLEEVKQREQIEMRTFGTKRECDVRYKVRAMGVKQQEPMLDLKKHRRSSRHQVKQKLALEVADEVEELDEAPTQMIKKT